MSVPSAPIITSVVNSDTSANIFYTDNGSAINDHFISLDNGITWTDLISTANPLVISSLTTGSTYVCQLMTHNTVGNSVASLPFVITPIPLASYISYTTITTPTAPTINSIIPLCPKSYINV